MVTVDDYVHPHDKSPLTKVQGSWRKKFDEIEEYFASLPKTDVGKYEWSPEGFDQKFEYWCAEQVTNFLYKKDMKKDMRRHHLVKLEDGLYQWRHEVAVWKIKRQHPEAIILNDLPEAEALAIFRAEMGLMDISKHVYFKLTSQIVWRLSAMHYSPCVRI